MRLEREQKEETLYTLSVFKANEEKVSFSLVLQPRRAPVRFQSLGKMYHRQELLKTYNFIRGKRLFVSIVMFGLFIILLLTAQGDDIEFDDFDDLLVTEDERRQLTDLEDVLLSPVQPISGRTIFFHETKRHNRAEKYVLNLTTRVACSIESAALHNPNFKIFVLFSSSLFLPKPGDSRYPIVNAILSYKNVQLRQVNLKQYAKYTPVEQWVQQGVLQRSR